eukprot:3151796-Prymnesium_polylepis.2
MRGDIQGPASRWACVEMGGAFVSWTRFVAVWKGRDLRREVISLQVERHDLCACAPCLQRVEISAVGTRSLRKDSDQPRACAFLCSNRGVRGGGELTERKFAQGDNRASSAGRFVSRKRAREVEERRAGRDVQRDDVSEPLRNRGPLHRGAAPQPAKSESAPW